MCGISGYFSITPQPACLVEEMTSLIRHRGPDDEGFVLFGGLADMPLVCGGLDTPLEAYGIEIPYAPREQISKLQAEPVTLALGHRRLSIVDLSPLGHQPMSYGDGHFWIVYNGEVYNHIELRAELESLGHRFISHSDTEIILAAYQQWGESCLHRFNGMFAFLLYDRKQNILFAARDRFGVKPLYYWVSPQGMVAFASEIKQFTVLPGWSARVNGQRAYDFLNWSLMDHTDETMFSGVFQLRGGQSLSLKIDEFHNVPPDDRLPVRDWYHLKPRQFDGTAREAADEFRRQLFDSVRLRLRADVPVGSCLSGGLDSSSIVCAMSQILQKSGAYRLQKTFSACADVKRFDEREFIDEVIRHSGVEGHYVYPDLAQLFNTNERITWHQDEPFGSTSIYAQWEVFKLAAANNVKVMLDGQGADEQLAGYHPYFGLRLARLFRAGHWWAFGQEVRAIYALHNYPVAWPFQVTLNALLPELIRQPLRKLAGKSTTMIPDWLDMDRLHAMAIDPFTQNGVRKARTVEELSHAQLTATNLQMLLHWEDRDSMAHSVESRVPFLDYRLVEFVLGLSEEYKISGGTTKRVMREGLKGILPDMISCRMDKLGFVTPEEVWLKERNPQQFRDALADAISASQGILKDSASKLLEDMISGRAPFSFLIWRMISFGVWMKTFAVK